MEQQNRSTFTQVKETTFDAGLQKHFQSVYNIMALGLCVTGLTAYVVAQMPAAQQFFVMAAQNPMIGLAIMALPMIGIMMLFSPSRVRTSSFQSLVMGFVAFSALWGALLSVIFMVYEPSSIVKTFFITAGTFAAMSIWGYTTKRDLSSMGAFLRMGVIGLLLAIVVNLFMQSPVMHMAISAIGVLIYTGLIAWDTQNIKETYSYAHGGQTNSKLAVMGALSLYVNFIMLFQFLLQFLGSRD
ncbi:MAG: Bax inhibitor-1 family protein [Alphaproteobacteria bacterium]